MFGDLQLTEQIIEIINRKHSNGTTDDLQKSDIIIS